MADEGFGIYVFCFGKRDSFWGFCARLFGVLPGYARGIFSSIEKCNPILVGFAKRSGVDLKLKHFADIYGQKYSAE